MLGEYSEPAARTAVHTLDVGGAKQTDPVGVPTKRTNAQIAGATQPRILNHIKRRPDQEIDADGFELPPKDLACTPSELRIPCGSDGHGGREFG